MLRDSKFHYRWGAKTMKRYYDHRVLVITLVLILSGPLIVSATEVDMEFKNAPLADVFQVLGDIAGYNVLIDPDVKGTISFYLQDLSVKSALDLIARTTGYGYEIIDNTMVIASNEKLKQEFAMRDFIFISLENVDVTAANQLLRMIFPGISTYVDPEQNVIVLSGLVNEIVEAKKLVELYDSIGMGYNQDFAFSSNHETLITKSIEIKFGEGDQIQAYLQTILPRRDFIWEPHLRLLTGSTTSTEWEQVVAIVSARDFPNFILKGIIQSGDRVQVLVENQGKTALVELNASLNGWTLTDVSGRSAQFSNGDLDFIIELGR